MFFVRSTIFRQPAGRFTPKFACGRTLVPDVSSPLLGVSVHWGRKKGAMKFSLLWESMGNFRILVVLSDISATPNFICIGTMSAYVPLPAEGSSGPWGAGGGGVKNSKNGGSHSCIGQLPFLFFSALPNVCRAQTCAHSRIEPSRSAKEILQDGQKVRKNFEFFTISRLYVHISQKRLKIEAYKQRAEKGLSLPYPTVACVWTRRSRGSTGWAKKIE